MQGSRRDHAKCNPSRRLERTRSPPVRGRGLKLSHRKRELGVGWSPPVRGRGLKLLTVGENRQKTMSPPVRGRGLKPVYLLEMPRSWKGSPPVRGRGLKLYLDGASMTGAESPPVRGRGLKRAVTREQLGERGSPPVRGRGLKHSQRLQHGRHNRVAPRAGARIETLEDRLLSARRSSRPPCGGAD